MTAVPVSAAQRILAAVWTCPEPAVASHRAAAHLWGLVGFARPAVDVTIVEGASRRSGDRHVHSTLRLPPSHVARIGPIPVTTVARTIFDLAGVEPLGRVERAVDQALARRECSIEGVHRVFFQLARRGRTGTAAMRVLLEARGETYVPPASELERRARALFERGGLPMPDFEVDLGDDGWIGRVDCLWRHQQVIVELDGRRYHDGLYRQHADRERDNHLVAAGWRVIRLTWDDIVATPDATLVLLRSALGLPTSS